MTSHSKQERLKRKFTRPVKRAVANIEKRDSTLYIRVKASNKKFIQKLSKVEEISDSELIDLMLDAAKTALAKKSA